MLAFPPSRDAKSSNTLAWAHLQAVGENPLATAVIFLLAALPVVLGLTCSKNNELSMAVYFGFTLLFACTYAGIVKVTRRRSVFNGRPKSDGFTETNQNTTLDSHFRPQGL